MRNAIRFIASGCALGVLAALTVHPALGAEEGQVQFNNRCRTCHSVREGDNRQGPSLHNIIGRKAGSLADYPLYSQALKSSGIAWSEDTLSKFIANPDAVVPGNNMKPYAGITDEGERQQIVKYLATLRSE